MSDHSPLLKNTSVWCVLQYWKSPNIRVNHPNLGQAVIRAVSKNGKLAVALRRIVQFFFTD